MPPHRPCNICPMRVQCLIISGICYIEEAGSIFGLVRAWLRVNLTTAQPAHIVAGQLVSFFWQMQNFLNRNVPDYRRIWNYLLQHSNQGLIKMYDGPNGRKWIELR